MSLQILFAGVGISSPRIGICEFTGHRRAHHLRAVHRVGNRCPRCGLGAVWGAPQQARRASDPGFGRESSGASRAVCRSLPRGVCDSQTTATVP